MGGKSLRIFLLLFQSLWLNVILPSHTRGEVTLAGWKSGVAASCCAAKCNPAAPGEHQPSAGDRANCALCFLSLIYLAPSVFVIDLAPGERVVEVLNLQHTQSLASRFPAPFWPTGPPAFA